MRGLKSIQLVADQGPNTINAEVDQESGLALLAFTGQVPPPNCLNLFGIGLFLDLGQRKPLPNVALSFLNE